MRSFIVCVLLLYSSSAVAEIRQVPAGGDLQAALNAAVPGDEIVLSSGATYTGEFSAPAKSSGPAIIVRSSSTLPDRRIGPADRALLATIQSGVASAALMFTKAGTWKIDGIAFNANVAGAGDIITIYDGSNITFDRVLIDVPDAVEQKRGIAMNGAHVTVTRSYIAGIKKRGQDSQALCAWDGPGPFTIVDNYLEAASENIMFGGANSRSSSHIPSDILVERNTLEKRASWRGQGWNIKNLFELKSARRVVVRQNLMVRNWSEGQDGYAVLFTVRNDEGGSPWSVVEDVLFERNEVRDSENGINILGYDGYQPSGRTTRVEIRNNLFVLTGGFLKVGSEVGVLRISHNTVDNQSTLAVLYKGDVWVAGSTRRPATYAVDTFSFTDNLTYHGEYGVWGEDAGIGTSAINALTLNRTWTNNVLATDNPEHAYPAVTWQVPLIEHKTNFIDTTNYDLTTTSVYRTQGTDGLPLGWSGRDVQTPPTPDPCVTTPLIFRVTAWPGGATGSRRGGWSSSRPAQIVWELRSTPWKVTATDDRGCVVMITR